MRQTTLAHGQGNSRKTLLALAGAAQGLITPGTSALVQKSLGLAAWRPSPCSRAALVGLPWRETTAPKDPMYACVGLSPIFAASAMLWGRLESIGPAPAHGAGSKGTR